MAHNPPVRCPACSSTLTITELTCPNCETKVQGVFEASPFQRLSREQLEFAEVFLRCRGNIKEVERDLGISYPTVRSRLDQLITAMGGPVAEPPSGARPDREEPADVLEALDAGELSFEEALERLQSASKDPSSWNPSSNSNKPWRRM